jgi:hypothetical protein
MKLPKSIMDLVGKIQKPQDPKGVHMDKNAFERGIEFAYRFGKVHPLHLRAYATKSSDVDCFVSGYLKVIQTLDA